MVRTAARGPHSSRFNARFMLDICSIRLLEAECAGTVPRTAVWRITPRNHRFAGRTHSQATRCKLASATTLSHPWTGVPSDAFFSAAQSDLETTSTKNEVFAPALSRGREKEIHSLCAAGMAIACDRLFSGLSLRRPEVSP
jgi:hypothetical protein